MVNYLFNQEEARNKLKEYFKKEKAELDSFGLYVNQTFEAHTFANSLKWYKEHGWNVDIKNPKDKKGKDIFKLKFSTRGAPSNYSYAVCKKLGETCQIRHQLRVSTRAYKKTKKFRANICCDIVVLNDINLDFYSTDDAVENSELISFGEVKHMSAYAELIAGFIGMVHELQPNRLKRVRIKKWSISGHIPPFLNVSGLLWITARGIKETIKRRKYDIDIYSYEDSML